MILELFQHVIYHKCEPLIGSLNTDVFINEDRRMSPQYYDSMFSEIQKPLLSLYLVRLFIITTVLDCNNLMSTSRYNIFIELDNDD